MIPTATALVCPKTHDTVAEDTCNIELTISQEYSGKRCVFRQSWSRLCRELLESFPILAGLHTFWFVSLPDTWDRFNKTHIVYVEGELAVGQIIMFPRVPSWRAVWRAIQLWWFCLHGFEHFCEEIRETNPKHCSEQRHIRSFAGLLKALSLRPTFQPTSTPEQASRLLRCKGDSWTNVLQFGLPWGKFNLLLTFSTDAKHRTEYCSSVCSIPSYGLLFVLTSFSFAPSTLFGFCLCSFQRKPGCHSIGPSYLISVRRCL